MTRSRARPRISVELERLGMADRAGDKVRQLNGGHRRRVEIARALLHQPDILLLDEPTVGLDPASRRELNSHVRGLCREQGITVLWATHLIDEVSASDDTIILHQGKVLAHASSADICRQQGTADLVEAFGKLTGDTGAVPLWTQPEL